MPGRGKTRSSRPGLWLLAVLVPVAWVTWQRVAPPPPFTDAEQRIVASLALSALPPLPPDPTNAVADDPRAAEFGHRLFFDARLSANGGISCATCHQPIRRFTDGLPQGVALGRSARNTPSIVGAAYSPWYYWDGRKDSQWSQALAPLEDPDEHGTDRAAVVALIAADDDYRHRYEALFGALPPPADTHGIDRAFANVGKALAAYGRLLMPGESRFDRYAAHLAAGGDYLRQEMLGADEVRGLRLFIGDAGCVDCHNGPLFTNNEFHNTGLLSVPGELPDRGRSDGVRTVLADPFNCLGEFSDDPERACGELRHVRQGPELLGATRTPSLRNLGGTAPFQSKGQFATLAEVLGHYNRAPDAMIGHNEAEPLGLGGRDLDSIEAFLHALEAPLATDARWLGPPER